LLFGPSGGPETMKHNTTALDERRATRIVITAAVRIVP